MEAAPSQPRSVSCQGDRDRGAPSSLHLPLDPHTLAPAVLQRAHTAAPGQGLPKGSASAFAVPSVATAPARPSPPPRFAVPLPAGGVIVEEDEYYYDDEANPYADTPYKEDGTAAGGGGGGGGVGGGGGGFGVGVGVGGGRGGSVLGWVGGIVPPPSRACGNVSRQLVIGIALGHVGAGVRDVLHLPHDSSA